MGVVHKADIALQLEGKYSTKWNHALSRHCDDQLVFPQDQIFLKGNYIDDGDGDELPAGY